MNLKRKVLIVGVVLSMTLACASGCRLLESLGLHTVSDDTPAPSLDTPTVQVYGSVLTWEKVEGATSYVVSNANGYSEEVTNTFCAPTQPSSGNYTVKAKNASSESEESSAVSIFNTAAVYGGSEEISLVDHKVYTIASTTDKVTITGSAEDTYIKISDRTTPLYIILDNVSLTSPQTKSCIGTYDAAVDKPYTVIVDVCGSNTLTTLDVTEVPSQPQINTGKTGGVGFSGGNGLALPNIVLIGSGRLSCKGGAGGAGGIGAGSSGVSLEGYGGGGAGGSGGSGIRCTNFFLNLSGDGIVYSIGGKGGKGGKPGENGSIVTGPFASLGWEQSFGKDGIDGVAVRGTVNKIKGMSEF